MASARAAQAAVEWAAAEGWNPGLDDRERFLAADPDSFLATDRSGEIVATVSCALYGDAYAFIGFYIVRVDLRGQRLGQSGFATSHRKVRWRTTGGGRRPDGPVELGSLPFGELLAFDAAVFGAERERFPRGWVDRGAGHALACVRDGRLTGYGVLRSCRVGAKVGPLFAEDTAAVDVLLSGREWETTFETARMYLNGRPPEDAERVYGVTTLEFG